MKCCSPTELDDEASAWLSQVKNARLCERPLSVFDPQQARRLLQEQCRVHTLDAFDCQGMTAAIGAAGAVLHYFRETQPTAPFDYIRRFSVRRTKEAMHLDSVTIRNLELVKPLGSFERDSRQTSLLSVLDRTVTAMGSRLLRQWIVRPLIQADRIETRLDAVGELKERMQERVAIRTALREVQDIARLNGRLVLHLAGPRELLALKKSLSTLPEILTQLSRTHSPLLAETRTGWDDARDLYDLIEQAVQPDAPCLLSEREISSKKVTTPALMSCAKRAKKAKAGSPPWKVKSGNEPALSR